VASTYAENSACPETETSKTATNAANNDKDDAE
jgi:hypothetical protein